VKRGCGVVGIERDESYFATAERRISEARDARESLLIPA
jgi:hypothetical protein